MQESSELNQNFENEPEISPQTGVIRLDTEDYNKLAEFRDNQLTILSGLNRESIIGSIPEIADIEGYYADRLKFYPSTSEALSAAFERPNSDLPVEAVRFFRDQLLNGEPAKIIKVGNGSTDEYKDRPAWFAGKWKKKWRGLLKALPDGSILEYHQNNPYLIATLPNWDSRNVPKYSGDTNGLTILFNMHQHPRYEDYHGIKIEAMLLKSQDESKVVDLVDIIEDGSNVFFKRELTRAGHVAIVKDDNKDPENVVLSSTICSLTIDPEGTLIHENEHSRYFRETGMNMDYWKPLLLSRKHTDRSILIAGGLSLLINSPLFIAAALAVNTGMYGLSRMKNNNLGKGYYDHINTEARSFLAANIIDLLLKKNGFLIKKSTRDFPLDSNKDLVKDFEAKNISQWDFDLNYEPFYYFLVDRLLNNFRENKKYKGKYKKNTAYHSMPATIGTNMNP